MSLFDTNDNGATGAGSTTARKDANGNVLPDAKVWINIGVPIKVENPDSGEVETQFLSLPMGIALDTMQAMVAKGSSESWAKTVQGKNALMALAQKLGADLEPGQAQIAEKFQVEIRRSKDKTAEPNASDNPIMDQLSEMGFTF